MKRTSREPWHKKTNPLKRSYNSFNPNNAAAGNKLISYPKPPYADPHLNVRLPFGKYKGKALGEILYEDAAYLELPSNNFFSRRENDPREAALK